MRFHTATSSQTTTVETQKCYAPRGRGGLDAHKNGPDVAVRITLNRVPILANRTKSESRHHAEKRGRGLKHNFAVGRDTGCRFQLSVIAALRLNFQERGLVPRQVS